MTAQGPSWLLTVLDGWTAEERNDHVVILPSTRDAELRLTTFDPSESGISANNWIAFCAHADRRKGRRAEPAAFGPFTGHAVEFEAGGIWVQGWVLEAQGDPLDVTYRCPASIAGRDTASIEAMLASIRHRRPAG